MNKVTLSIIMALTLLFTGCKKTTTPSYTEQQKLLAEKFNVSSINTFPCTTL